MAVGMSKPLLKSCGIPGWFNLYETLLASANSQITNAERRRKRALSEGQAPPEIECERETRLKTLETRTRSLRN